MIVYRFEKNEIGTLQFIIEDKFWQLSELGSCSDDYLEEIVTELEKVLKGEVEVYEFGYEVYNLECDKEICKVLNTFEDWQEEAIIPTQDIYELLRDWKEFLYKNQS